MMRQLIEQFLSDEERASRIILNWIVTLGVTGGLYALGAILLLR